MKIYVLIDPRDNSIRYVGTTRQEYIASRRQGHIHDRRKNQRTSWIAELAAVGMEPSIAPVHRTCGEDDESYWIRWFREAGHPLTNSSSGGPGRPGMPMHENTKSALVASLIGGKAWDQERRERQAERIRGTRQSAEQVAKRVAAIAAKRADGTFKKRPRETRTHCKNGHEYDEVNTYRNGKGTRICRTCNRLRARVR